MNPTLSSHAPAPSSKTRKLVISPACLARYGLLASDLSTQSTQVQPSHPWTAPIPAVICNIYCRCAHYQEEDSPQMRSEEEGGEGGEAEGVIAKPLTNQQIKHREYKARCRKEKRLKANLNLSGVAHLPVHISNPNPNAKIQFFDKSFICWADQSRENIIAVVKFHPFSTMDPALKSQYQRLSQHLIAQSTYQNPNQSNGPQYAGKMYSLGWRKGYETASKIGTTGIAAKVAKDPEGYRQLQTLVPEQNTFIGERFYSVSGPLFEEVKQQHNALNAPGLEPNFKEDPNGFTSHLSFTISNFANTPHKDDDASPFSFVMWIPIDQTTGNLIEKDFAVQGGEFVFPDDSCGINFAGFNGIVECAWKATEYSHLTLPSHTPSNSLHTRMGLSCQLPKRTKEALQKIKDNYYLNHPTKSHWGIRDMNKIISDSAAYNKEWFITFFSLLSIYFP